MVHQKQIPHNINTANQKTTYQGNKERTHLSKYKKL